RPARRLHGWPGIAPVERPRGDRDERPRFEVELLIENEMLRAVRERHDALERHPILVEKALGGTDELLSDLLVLVRREDGDRAEQTERPPANGHRDADDLSLVLLGNIAAPRFHKPAVVHVLGTPEHLPRPGAELALEEVAERRL